MGEVDPPERVELGSNGDLMEAEAVAAAVPIVPVAEELASRLPVKNWSDFNAVSAKTFGDQRFGSFSDLLAPLPLPSTAPLDFPVSDTDFFDLGAVRSELPGSDATGNATTTMSHEGKLTSPSPEAPAWSDLTEGPVLVEAASAADAYPGWYWDYDVGEWREVDAPIEPDAVQNFSETSTNEVPAVPAELGLEQQSQSWDSFELGAVRSEPEAGLPGSDATTTMSYEEKLTSPPEPSPEAPTWSGLTEGPILTGAASAADAYPGWYWDYDSGQWRESDAPIAVQTVAETSTSGVPALGLEQQSQSSTQTVADEYPGWKWDYAAQTWVAVPDYKESPSSSSWQTSSEAQSPAFESWHQVQQQPYNNDSTNVFSNPVVSSQQPQSFFPGRANGFANTGSPVNTGSVYLQDSKQWQGEASSFSFPHTNGDQGWPAAPGLGLQEQSMSSGYNYPANGGLNQNYLQQNQQQQQPWGNAFHFNQQQFTNPKAAPPKNIHEAMRTCVGRPPHSLAAFGFGGKFIFMKHRDPVTLHTSNGDQAFASGEAWMPGPIQVSSLKTYLPREPTFAGPLMGGGSVKELNKWIDEQVATQSPYDSSRLLLGVLKVACQHYGKLRSSSVNDGNPAMEEDGPEAALAKLLAGAGGEQGPFAGLASRSPLLRGVPLEQQLQGTALEVKKFLVCGKRKDALKCAQEGELWGVALLIARQLGEKCFCDTVTEMARRQFVSGSPLRTLSLLLAGQPAEVFAAPGLQPGSPMNGVPVASDQDGQGAMLDDWQENIAIMAANRTQGDERVMLHLGDRLWGVRGEVAAAHLCYLVADANFEAYSGNARLCLIGADHCKNPRTFVTPEAIQRTEIYEYAKVLGNPQSILLSFQPYKLVYAEMLAECGNPRDSLKYCQTVLKTLKSAGVRSPEVEACKLLATSLEERLRLHMQDGYGSHLAPRQLVNKIKGTMDWGISKLIGGPPTAPAIDSFGYRPLDNGDHFGSQTSHPGTSAGQRSGTLAPSASIAASMERLPQEPNRGPARSQSEPDFGRNAKQGETEGASPRAAGLRLAGLGRLGSNILQRATGLWGSNKKEAKLGDANKFYYDEKLKKWVEEGVDPTPDVAPPPPPPTTSSFMKPSVPSQEETYAPPPQAATSKPGTPPLAPTSNNYYSNRRQSGGVRSRYVDTFNKGGSVSPAKSVMGSLLPPSMPGGGGMTSTPSMFVPGPVPSTSFSGNTSDVSDNFVGGSPLSDTANSNGNTDSGLGYYTPSTYSTIPQASTGFASADFSSHVFPGGAHTKSSSWGGYPSSFQNPVISGEEDVSFSGYEHAPVAQSAYPNFHLPNGNTSFPSPPPSGNPGSAGDSNRQFVGQQFRVSRSVDSLTGEEMQEVEL